MLVNRRRLLLGSLALVATPARAQTEKPQGLDAAQFGVRAHAGVDQTRQLQRAIDRAAQALLSVAYGQAAAAADDSDADSDS